MNSNDILLPGFDDILAFRLKDDYQTNDDDFHESDHFGKKLFLNDAKKLLLATAKHLKCESEVNINPSGTASKGDASAVFLKNGTPFAYASVCGDIGHMPMVKASKYGANIYYRKASKEDRYGCRPECRNHWIGGLASSKEIADGISNICKGI